MPILNPLPSKEIPQLSLPDHCKGKLAPSFSYNDNSYRVNYPNKIVTPKGKYIFVVKPDEPQTVWCLNPKDTYEKKLSEKVLPGVRNYGHSSFGHIPISDSTYYTRPNGISWGKHIKNLATPMLLAGMLYFNNDGFLEYWTVESGHYRPTSKNAAANRVGFVRYLLPWSKFISCDFNNIKENIISLGWK